MQAPTTAPTALLGDAVRVANGRVDVTRPEVLRTAHVDALAREAALGQGPARDHARWLIWEIAQAVGVRPASIHGLYAARACGAVRGFTVPVINARALAYDTARALFRTAVDDDAGAFIFELTRSEIVSTEQRPAEYAAMVLAAALREGFRGPVFLQGGHFQVSAQRHGADPRGEVAAVKQLALEAVSAGFHNLELDTSTLAAPTGSSEHDPQRPSYEVAADLLCYVRDIEPGDVTVCVGAEISADGGAGMPRALRGFLDGLSRAFRARAPAAMPALSTVSFRARALGLGDRPAVRASAAAPLRESGLDTLAEVSRIAREEYGLAGVGLHGASGLSDDAFGCLPRLGAAEVHFATRLQDLLFHVLPEETRRRVHDWIDRSLARERQAAEQDEDYYYRMRRRALGAFKRELWELPDAVKKRYDDALSDQLSRLFAALGVVGTAEAVARYVELPVQHRSAPAPAEGSPGAGPR